MANRNPNPTTRFRKGRSGNPKGRPPLTDQQAEFKRRVKRSFDDIAWLFWLNAEELARYRTKETPSILAGFATAVLRFRKTGDISALQGTLDRIFGRVGIKVEAIVERQRPDLSAISNEELAKLEAILSKAKPLLLPSPHD